MEKALQITLISNAGLLLEYQGIAILLDGIFGRDGHKFSNLDSETWTQMLQGRALFSKIDYLLFTHAHPDHFSPDMTLQFLKIHKIKGMFKPVIDMESALDNYLNENRVPCISLTPQINRTIFRIEPHISIRTFSTKHLDKKYHDIQHFCYLISFDEVNVLFTADVDYMSESFSYINGVPLHAVFVNPLFFHVLNDPKHFKARLDTNTIIVYHVPYEKDDIFRIRAMLTRDIKSWPEANKRVIPLMEPFQQIQISENLESEKYLKM